LDAGDNAAMANRIAIATRIERPYHRRRRQTGPGRLTPTEYEAIMSTPARQAA
jgi:putative transposase